MIVFIAGMQRSGSTFSFNIVRELLERRGTAHQEASPAALPAVERSSKSRHVLIKAHSTDDVTLRLVELGAIRAVCTIRRPEDAIASWIETFGFELDEAIAHMQEWLNMFARLRHHALVIRYEYIDRQPWCAAWRIARYVCPDAQPLEVVRIARRYSKKNVKTAADALGRDGHDIQDVSFSYYDTRTFFHRHHVSNMVSKPAADRIGEDAVSCIRRTLKTYIDENGALL